MEEDTAEERRNKETEKRYIYNKVVKQYRLEDRKPFDDLFTGHAKTVKRAATDDDIKRLQTMILL